MRIAALTGGIASGKTMVARRLADGGAHVIDADAIAREVTPPGSPALAEIVDRFGDSVVAADGTLDREALGRRVFADRQAREALEAITHPRILATVRERLEQLQRDGSVDVTVVDIPLLVERDVGLSFDAVIVVAAEPETQIKRLVGDRGLSREEAQQRLAAQAPLEDKLAVATHVIRNDGSLAELRERTDEVLAELGGMGAPR